MPESEVIIVDDTQQIQNILNSISTIFNMLLVNIGDMNDYDIYVNKEKEKLIQLIITYIEKQAISCINVVNTLNPQNLR